MDMRSLLIDRITFGRFEFRKCVELIHGKKFPLRQTVAVCESHIEPAHIYVSEV